MPEQTQEGGDSNRLELQELRSDTEKALQSTESTGTGATLQEETLTRHVSRMDPNLVWFKPGDPENPYEWSNLKKAWIVAYMCIMTLWVLSVSAFYAPAAGSIAEEFNVKPIVSRIGIAATLFGFSFGPVVLTPISEDYGRKPVTIVCGCLSFIFCIPCALAPNLAALIVCRFISGFFSSVIFNACANVPDMYVTGDDAGSWALNCWCLSAEIFTFFAPLVGSYINVRHGWRWIFWWSMIVGFILLVPYTLFVPETRSGVLLARRAKKLRKETGNIELYAEHEVVGQRGVREVIKETLIRPVWMLCTEPIVFWFAFLDGYNYAIYYLGIEAIPTVYATHGIYDPTVEYLLATFMIGGFLGVALFYFQLKAQKRMEQKHGGMNIPEAKLLWCLPAAIVFPICLFLFAWLSFPHIHWAASVVWFIPFGVVGHVIFLAVSDYTVDAYGHLASSAVTGQSFAREISSGVLTIVGATFFENLGGRVAGSILGGIAAALCFVPFVFFKYGSTIRARSGYSLMIKEAAEKEATMRKEEELCRSAQANLERLD